MTDWNCEPTRAAGIPTAAADDHSGHEPYVLINTFTPIDGGMDDLVAFQLAQMQDLAPESSRFGWLGNEVYRADDANQLIVVTRFRSVAAKRSWAQTDRFRRHLDELKPLIETVSSLPVSFLAAHGPAGRITSQEEGT